VCVCVCVCVYCLSLCESYGMYKYAGWVKCRIWMFKQVVHLVNTVLQRIKEKSLWVIALFKGAFFSNLNKWRETWPLMQCAVQWSGLEGKPTSDQTEHGGSPAERTVCPLLTARYRHKQLSSRLTQRHQPGDTTTWYMSDCSWLYSVTLTIKFPCTFLDNVQRSSSSGSRDNSVGIVGK
jgi:hypothetical protein